MFVIIIRTWLILTGCSSRVKLDPVKVPVLVCERQVDFCEVTWFMMGAGPLSEMVLSVLSAALHKDSG